jgi:hypothetical protein
MPIMADLYNRQPAETSHGMLLMQRIAVESMAGEPAASSGDVDAVGRSPYLLEARKVRVTK